MHRFLLATCLMLSMAPTFANTIEAMEFSGDLLTRVTYVFYNLTSANTNEALQDISKQLNLHSIQEISLEIMCLNERTTCKDFNLHASADINGKRDFKKYIDNIFL